MPKLPRLTGKQLIALLQREGYTLVGVKGSHHKFRKPDGTMVMVPLHGNRTIPIGTLHYTVTKMMGLTVDEFLKLMEGY